MNQISISDVTMKRIGRTEDITLSFKEKIDLARILDRLNVSVIEVDAIEHPQIDSLLLKSISSAVKNSTIAVPVTLEKDSVEATAAALKEAKKFRLQVPVPVSAVQMEYIAHKKPDAILASIGEIVAECKKYTDCVEFQAVDATRAEEEFVKSAIEIAIDAGAEVITLCDTAGCFLPEEFVAFINDMKELVPALNNAKLAIHSANELSMADSCTIAAIKNGIDEVKAAACGSHTASLEHIVHILGAKSDRIGANSSVRQTEIKRGVDQIVRICRTQRSKRSPFDNSGVEEEPKVAALNARDDMPAVMAAVKRLGYDLSEEDAAAVFEAFQAIAKKKESVSSRELDAIVASAALQVPPTYRVESYVINSGNIITATAHI
ncbi:MAG: hypothetical protein IJO94_03690, partial [Firmicutes bacterium]|nr:hypothetical protein [Bacillota bacterium]